MDDDELEIGAKEASSPPSLRPVRLSDFLTKSTPSHRIHANFKNIEVIDSVPVRFRRECRTLFLSQNHIVALKGLGQFRSLSTISLSYNRISNESELAHLDQFRDTLRHLSLKGNPLMERVSDLRQYRLSLRRRFPSLGVLDGIRFEIARRRVRPASVRKHNRSPNRRKPAEVILEKSKDRSLDSSTISPHSTTWRTRFLRVMFVLDLFRIELHRETTMLGIKLELYRRAYGTHSVFCVCEPPDDTHILERYRRRRNVVVRPPSEEESRRYLSVQWGLRGLVLFCVRNWVALGVLEERMKLEMSRSNLEQRIEGFGVEFMKRTLMELDRLPKKEVERGRGGCEEEELSESESPPPPVTSFKVLPRNRGFMRVLFLLLRDSLIAMFQLEDRRKKYLEANFWSLSVPGVIARRRNVRTHPSDAWRLIGEEFPKETTGGMPVAGGRGGKQSWMADRVARILNDHRKKLLSLELCFGHEQDASSSDHTSSVEARLEAGEDGERIDLRRQSSPALCEVSKRFYRSTLARKYFAFLRQNARSRRKAREMQSGRRMRLRLAIHKLRLFKRRYYAKLFLQKWVALHRCVKVTPCRGRVSKKGFLITRCERPQT